MNQSSEIKIGHSPIIFYYKIAIEILNRLDYLPLIILARGKMIYRAIDLLEILKKNLGSKIKIVSIESGTIVLKNKSGIDFNCSTIQIVLKEF